MDSNDDVQRSVRSNPFTTHRLKSRHERKLVLVGDTGSGKTSLFAVFGYGYLPQEHIETDFETHNKEIELDDEVVDLAMWDTTGNHSDNRRTMIFDNADVFVVCFSVDDEQSLLNTQRKWIPEIRHFRPRTPIVLVATKIDRRSNPAIQTVSSQKGRRMARHLGLETYKECSALTRLGVTEVFQSAALAAIEKTTETSPGCCCVIL